MAHVEVHREIREIERESKKKRNIISRLSFKKDLCNQMVVLQYYKGVIDRFQNYVLVKCNDSTHDYASEFRATLENLLSEPSNNLSEVITTKINGLELSVEEAINAIHSILRKYAIILDLYDRIIISRCDDHTCNPRNFQIPSIEVNEKKIFKILKAHALRVSMPNLTNCSFVHQ